jgi:hypothetical protein
LPSYRWYIGRALEFELLCEACRADRNAGKVVETGPVCTACSIRIEDDIAKLVGIDGSPGILERRCPVRTELRHVMVPEELGEVVDFAPLERAGSSSWLALSSLGHVFRIDAEAKSVTTLCDVALPLEPVHQPWCGHELRHRLHVSGDGHYGAVVNDYGKSGIVFEVQTGRVTMELDGGTGHHETVPFSACFVEHGGRPALVHRADWNRLDVSDPASGLLLTPREHAAYECEEGPPEHHLDYFHGALYPSPGYSRLLDDGWIWQPVGVPFVWSLERWLSDNVWESEDGPTKTYLCMREYYWDHAMCWVGEDLVAVEGIGDDDELMVPGVRIFDPAAKLHEPGRFREAAEVRCFAGPTGALFSDGARLFSSNETGLSVWDVTSGERLGMFPGFVPARHHHAARELGQYRPDDRHFCTWPIAR